MKERRVVIRNGVAEFIYGDDLAPLARHATVTRASHVEPHPTRPGWLADMRPSGGPVLGRGFERTPEAIAWSRHHHGTDGIESLPPFETRQAALDAELAWLRKHRGL